MPSKKKKYNARFPAGRIKKIMQTDEEIGKVAQAVPVIISRTLELFVESLLKRAMQITSAKNAKTLTPTHMKQCILSESRFDFLKDLVKGIPDVSSIEEEFGTPCGTLSPGTPMSAKAYTCFQFHQTPDSGSSRSSSIASQPSTPLQTSQPKFYKEIPIGSDDFENKNSYENSIPSAFGGTTVIQRTGSHFSNSYSQPGASPQSTSAKSAEQVASVAPVDVIARNSTGRNQLNELKLSNCIKMQSDNSTVERKQEVVGRVNDEDEDEQEEDTDEEYGVNLEVRENGYHRAHKADAIDEDYDT